MPTPRPETFVTCLRRREARQEDQLQRLSLTHPRRLVRRHDTLLHSLLTHSLDVDPGAVVRDLDDHLPALMKGAQCEPALRGLASLHPCARCLDAVVHRVADQVREGILDCLEDRLVEFGLLAFHLDRDLLAARLGEVAYDARELAPDVPDRLHARLHHAFLQLRGHQIEALRRGQRIRVRLRRVELHDLIAREHEFAHQCHEPIEKADVDANRAVTGGAARLGVRGRRSRGCRRFRVRRYEPLFSRSLERGELLREHAVVDVAFSPALLDGREDLANRIHHRQQRARHLRIETEDAVSELGEQALALVGERPELREREEARRSLDRVDRPEDPRQGLDIRGILLERDEVTIELVEVLVAFDEELVDQVVDLRNPPMCVTPVATENSCATNRPG